MALTLGFSFGQLVHCYFRDVIALMIGFRLVNQSIVVSIRDVMALTLGFRFG